MSEYIIPGVITFVVGIAVGFFLWLIKKDRLSLEYDVDESDSFPREEGMGKYFICSLKNNGNKAIENITLKINLDGGLIDSVEFSSSELLTINSQENSLIDGVVPLLNPEEKISAIITIKNAQSNAFPKIEARAVGVTAKQRSSETSFKGYYGFLAAGFSVVVAMVGFIGVLNESNRSRLQESIKSLDMLEEKINSQKEELDQGKPERVQIIFAILNKAGLSRIIPGLISISGEGIAYWKTGLHLMHSYLLNKSESKKYVKSLVHLSNTEGIAPSSKGFLLYLAGRIEKEEGRTSDAIQYFNQCKNETPLMYEHLMANDPAYDLKAIEVELLKGN
jgi:hypothetical protein